MVSTYKLAGSQFSLSTSVYRIFNFYVFFETTARRFKTFMVTGRFDTHFHATILLVPSYRFIHSYKQSDNNYRWTVLTKNRDK